MDIVFILIILAAAAWGFYKGFVAQIVGIISLLIGVWCAFKLSGEFALYTKNWFDSSTATATIKIFSFILIIALVVLLGHLLGHVLEGVMKLTMLNWLNRVLGIIFSAFKAILILSIIVYLIKSTNSTFHLFSADTLNNSKTYKLLDQFSMIVFPYLKSLF